MRKYTIATLKVYAALFVIWVCRVCNAEPLAVEVLPSDERQNISSLTKVLHENGVSLSPLQALNMLEGVYPTGREQLTLTIDDNNHWLLFHIKNTEPHHETRILNLDYSFITKANLYEITGSKPTLQSSVHITTSAFERPIPYRSPSFTLQLPPQQKTIFLVQIQVAGKANHALEIRPRLYSAGAFIEHQLVKFCALFGFIGFLLSLVIYNSILYLRVGIKSYIYYCLYLSCYIFIVFFYEGLVFYFPTPPPVHWVIGGMAILPALAGLSLIAFGRSILRLAEFYPRLDKIYYYTVASVIVLLPISFWLHDLLAFVLEVSVVAVTLSLGFVAWLRYRQGDKSAKYFGLSFVIISVGYGIETFLYSVPSMAFVNAATMVNIIAWVEQYFFYTCAAIEMVLLSLALASYIEELRDKSELAQIEVVKQSAKFKAIELANKEKSRFLAAASHDLRQPLHAMNLFLDAIKHSEGKDERLKFYGQLENSVSSLTQLFDALLDISKLDAGVVEVHRSPIVVNDLFKKLATEFSLVAKQKNIRLSYRYTSLVVESDPIWLERILRNLISNSLRYTEVGRVLLTCRKRAGKVIIQVWDTGSGIEAAQLGCIFDEFTQLDHSADKQGNGLGLGLAIVKRLCRLLDHNISVNSTLNRGSVFSLEVPKSELTVAKVSRSSIEQIPVTALSKRILVIDDDVEILDAMAAMLTKWGCEVLVASSCSEALEIIEKGGREPDAIVSDYLLEKNETGLDVLAQLQHYFGHPIPAIIVTAETDKTSITKIRQHGFKILHKPLRPAKLRILLNSLLHN
ncbi:hybrid sensor histidine kinase/response regulator [Saccharophagus degradans]|uniref:hybrid sensor histidine kinase/response regulator n=1 Tax=Saccharophagus degradans TaxID=86304 RepID=UPI001C092F2D|nr:hybrid sensor histidine kinase/response regulator [Saccharophagus degradans]